jgi:hypothetical protein
LIFLDVEVEEARGAEAADKFSEIAFEEFVLLLAAVVV